MNRRGLLAGIIALSLATGSVAYAAEAAPAAPATPPAEITNAPAAPQAPVAVAPAAAPAPAPAAATPLATRPAKPLQLQPKDEGTPFGYKLLAGLGLAAAAGLWLRKKKQGAGGTVEKKKVSSIDILSRKSVGVRNELLVIDVEGTRLLVGMTPGAMQTLAVLDQPESLTEVSEDVKADTESRPTIQRLPEPVSAASEDDEDELPPVSYVPPKPRLADSANVAALDQKVRSLLANRAAEPTRAQTQSMTVPKPQRRRANNNAKTARIAGQAKGLLLAMNEDSDTLARTGES